MSSLAPAEKAPAGKPLKVGSGLDVAQRKPDRSADAISASDQQVTPPCAACAAGVAPCPACGGKGGAGMLQRKLLGSPSGGAFIQAKLTVGEPNDVYEQEADRVAEQVMRMPQTGRSIQHEIDPKKVEEGIQMMPSLQWALGENLATGGNLQAQLNSSKGGGGPLPDDVRSFMESRFGADFSQVRAHTGSESVHMNQDLNAQAFTHKHDVYFGAGKAPGKDALTAHELTHVLQQTGRNESKPNQALGSRIGSTPSSEEKPNLIQRDALSPSPAAGVTAPSPPVPGSPTAASLPAAESPEIRQGSIGDIAVILPNWTIFDAYSKTKHWGDEFTDVKIAKINVPIPELASTVALSASGGAGANFSASLGPGILRNIRIGLSYKQAAAFFLLGPARGIGVLLALGEFRGLADLDVRGRISLDANIHAELKAAAEFLGAFEVANIAGGLGARAGGSFDLNIGGTIGLYYQDRHLRFRFSEALDAQLQLFFSLYAYIKASLLGYTWTKNWNLVKKDLGLQWNVGSRLDLSYDNGLTINVPDLIESAWKAAEFAEKMIGAADGESNVIPFGPGGSNQGGNPPPPSGPIDSGGFTPSSAPTGMTRSDPIEMIWNKPLGRYRNPLWLMGTPYYRNQRQRLSSRNRWIGVPFWPGPGDIVRRVTTFRGRAADDFKVGLEEDGFDDWEAYSPDHVTDLMFGGDDDFTNLWPLDRNTNARAGTWHWGQGVWFSNPNDPTVRREAIGSTTLDGRYFRIKQVADPP